MQTTTDAPAPDPLAVFARLLSGNDQRALKLLPGSAVTAPGGLTTLHAAVAGLCGAAVLAAAVAAGAPLEARLEQSQFGGDLYRFLGQIGCPKKVQAWLFEDDTALGIAMRCGSVHCGPCASPSAAATRPVPPHLLACTGWACLQGVHVPLHHTHAGQATRQLWQSC